MPEFELNSNSQDLLDTLDRRGAEQTPIDLFFLFSKDKADSLEFEIIFMTLVTSAVLSVPSTGTALDWMSKVATFLLIGVTFVRRIGLDNSWKSTELIYNKTFQWVWILSVFCIAFAVLSITQLFVSNIPQSSSTIQLYLMWSSGLIALVFTLILSYEYIFGDMFLWAAVLFYNQSTKRGIFYPAWIQLSNLVLNASFRSLNDRHYAITKIRHHFHGGEKRTIGVKQGFMLLLVISIPLSIFGSIVGLPYSIIAGVSVALSAITFTAATFSSAALAAFLSFFYQRYGTTSFEETPNWTFTVPVVVFMLIIHTIGYTDWSFSRIQMPPPLF